MNAYEGILDILRKEAAVKKLFVQTAKRRLPFVQAQKLRVKAPVFTPLTDRLSGQNVRSIKTLAPGVSYGKAPLRSGVRTKQMADPNVFDPVKHRTQVMPRTDRMLQTKVTPPPQGVQGAENIVGTGQSQLSNASVPIRQSTGLGTAAETVAQETTKTWTDQFMEQWNKDPLKTGVITAGGAYAGHRALDSMFPKQGSAEVKVDSFAEKFIGK